MGFAYSHPKTRWKGRPIAGLLTVAIGQGVLAALGGWVAANPDLAAITLFDWLGLLAAALVTVGFYPLTQIYQIDEDLRRGDLTFAAWAGPRGAFAFAIAVQGIAAVILIAFIAWRLGWWNALLVGVFYAGLLAAIVRWAYTFNNAEILANFRRVMRINMLTSLGFIGFIALHLFTSILDR
jgi:1,4-dihydroxy-2-naphthoate octaprenyltransferase